MDRQMGSIGQDAGTKFVIADELLALLRCPVSFGPVVRADEAMLEAVNARIAAGKISNRLEQSIDRPLDGGLYSPTAKLLYPVWDGIPTLIAEEAISWETAVGHTSG
jgi:uncharacterized protein YbaR (Trm112 family)